MALPELPTNAELPILPPIPGIPTPPNILATLLTPAVGTVARLANMRLEVDASVDPETGLEAWPAKTLDPISLLSWDVKLFNYQSSEQDVGEFSEILIIGIEDVGEESQADDWKDIMLEVAKRTYEEAGETKTALMISIWCLMERKVRLYYKDSLIFSYDPADPASVWYNRGITLPWEEEGATQFPELPLPALPPLPTIPTPLNMGLMTPGLPIVSKLADVKIEIDARAADPENYPAKTIESVSLLSWDVRAFNYQTSTETGKNYNGEQVLVVGIEEVPEESRADNWRDIVVCLRKMIWANKEPAPEAPAYPEELLISIFNLMGRSARIYYKDEMIYDYSIDGARKPWIFKPWTEEEAERVARRARRA